MPPHRYITRHQLRINTIAAAHSAPAIIPSPPSSLTVAALDSPVSGAPVKSHLQQDLENGTTIFPAEIRRRIWFFLLPPPRTIKLSERRNLSRGDGPKGKNKRNFYTFWVDSTYSVPKLMAICQESRWFARQHYALILHDTLLGQPIFFDFSVDTLFFQSQSVLRFAHGVPGWAFSKNPNDSFLDLQSGLKNLAVGWEFDWSLGVPLEEFIKGMKSLERLTLEDWFEKNKALDDVQADEAKPENSENKKIFSKDGGILEIVSEDELERRVKETEQLEECWSMPFRQFKQEMFWPSIKPISADDEPVFTNPGPIRWMVPPSGCNTDIKARKWYRDRGLEVPDDDDVLWEFNRRNPRARKPKQIANEPTEDEPSAKRRKA